MSSKYGIKIHAGSVPTNNKLGISGGPAGDLNNDGIDDFIVGSGNFDSQGITYVVFGNKNIWTNGDIHLSDLTSSQGIVIYGEWINGNSFTLGSVGDVNNDGISDIIIGAPHASPELRNWAGEVYIIFGQNTSSAIKRIILLIIIVIGIVFTIGITGLISFCVYKIYQLNKNEENIPIATNYH